MKNFFLLLRACHHDASGYFRVFYTKDILSNTTIKIRNYALITMYFSDLIQVYSIILMISFITKEVPYCCIIILLKIHHFYFLKFHSSSRIPLITLDSLKSASFSFTCHFYFRSLTFY